LGKFPSSIWKNLPKSANSNILYLLYAGKIPLKNILVLRDGSEKVTKSLYNMISANMRNREDELLQQINCHPKESAMEGPD